MTHRPRTLRNKNVSVTRSNRNRFFFFFFSFIGPLGRVWLWQPPYSLSSVRVLYWSIGLNRQPIVDSVYPSREPYTGKTGPLSVWSGKNRRRISKLNPEITILLLGHVVQEDVKPPSEGPIQRINFVTLVQRSLFQITGVGKKKKSRR